MDGLTALYIAGTLLMLMVLFLGWSDWRTRKRERHAH